MHILLTSARHGGIHMSVIPALGILEAGRTGVQGHCQLHNELENSLGYMNLFFWGGGL